MLIFILRQNPTPLQKQITTRLPAERRKPGRLVEDDGGQPVPKKRKPNKRPGNKTMKNQGNSGVNAEKV